MGKQGTTRKRPGPKPADISLASFTFDEVLDAVLTAKPKRKRQGKDTPQKVTKDRKKEAE